MRSNMFTKPVWALLLLCFAATAWGQSPVQTAQRFLEENYKKYNLTAQDVSEYMVTDMYTSEHNGVTHLYLTQSHKGIKVYNAIFNFNIAEDGRVFHVGNRFVADLHSKINASKPSITPEQAVASALNHLGSGAAVPQLKERVSDISFVFEKGDASFVDIPVELRYQVMDNAEVRLAWDLSIDLKGSADYWSLRVDALTGEVLNKNNYTVYCNVSGEAFHNHDAACRDYSALPSTEKVAKESGLTSVGSYNVYAEVVGGILYNHESPAHGGRNLITDPDDPTASPYGWHDTNGSAGAEFTITRGNNVHAYLDLDNDDTPAGDEPDGGPGLVFDFPLDEADEPSEYRDAAVTNLFYMNNILHDFSYGYGFTEAAGNFQQNNYGNGGNGNDYVLGQAQDGGGTNNANFATPPDGGNGRMQMYLWGNPGGSQYLQVDAPSVVAGKYTTGLAAGWGATITDVPVSGEVTIVDDGIVDPYSTDACEDITSDVTGKIAIIDRGGCEFGSKALRAENAGAIGVIICNFEDAVIGMAGGADGASVTIPVVFIASTDCALIRQYADDNLEVSLVAPSTTGPSEFDGDLDNGIIAHEFAHGISNRLTGGPSTGGCLSNTEQMGEGWSDFFTLVTTVKPGDSGDMRRGIGTYVQNEPNNGQGIRTYPYSTDFVNNPHTYGDAPGESVPHGVGSIWCAALWDMYWAFVDEYGFDNDIYHGTGGNNMAVQLVMDGMKMQSCNPGFIDGRDAILAADEILYDGANQCLIWEVFARRGIGYFSSQGSNNAVGDETEDFEPLPTCIQELKISKSVTPLITAGDDFEVTLTVTNHKLETLTGVEVTDEIPAGSTFKSATGGGTQVGDMVVFDVGTMEFEDVVTLTYTLTSDPSNPSVRIFEDFLDDSGSEDNWFIDNPFGFDIWEFGVGEDAYTGNYTWSILATELENRQVVQLVDPLLISGDRPVVRFYHSFNSEPGADGGLFEVSFDGTLWEQVGDDMIRNGYNSSLQYGTFVVPNLQAFSGNSSNIEGNENGYIGTYVDMGEYAGQEVYLRFRFGSDDNTTVPGGLWKFDDFELMDMVNYNSEACATSDQGDEACASARAEGTIVESDIVSSTQAINANTTVEIFPNPAQNVLNVALSSIAEEDVVVSLMTVDGRELEQRNLSLNQNQQIISLNVSDLPTGFYVVKVTNGEVNVIEKVIIE